MCTPGLVAATGMSAGALAFGSAGLAVSSVGTFTSIMAARQTANFQAAIARNNQIIALRNAADARARGAQEIEQIRIQSKEDRRRAALAQRQLSGQQAVSQATLGQAVGSVSAKDLRMDTAAVSRLEELTQRRNERFAIETRRANAEREAVGLITQGLGFEAEARLADFRGRTATTAGIIKGLGTVITTGRKVSEKWVGFGTTVPSFPSPGAPF